MVVIMVVALSCGRRSYTHCSNKFGIRRLALGFVGKEAEGLQCHLFQLGVG